MRLEFDGQQALSRKYAVGSNKWPIVSSPENLLKYRVEYELTQEPFTLAVASLIGRHPCAGAFEYFDDENDLYLSARWLAKLKIKGWIEFPDDWVHDHRALAVLRVLLWRNVSPAVGPIKSDQRSSVLGYRREFQHIPSLDIVGKIRPSSNTTFYPTEVSEPLGPGYVELNAAHAQFDTQLVWSELLKFPSRTTFEVDKAGILAMVAARVRHFNSHSELRDSRRYIDTLDRKAAIMAAACAADACLRHCIETKFLSLPKGYKALGFDEKIAKVLELAELPPFTQLEPEHARNLLYLYRARNTRHEGDCYYNDLNDNRITLNTIDQVKPLVESAQTFVFWMDSAL